MATETATAAAVAVSPKTRKAGESEEDGAETEETTMQPSSSIEESTSTSNPNPNPNPSSSSCGFAGMVDEKEWTCFRDDDVLQQHSAILEEEALKIPLVGDKEPLSALAAECQLGSPILQQKVKLIGEQYAFLRRTRGDGNCFFRSFMFSYLERILETQDKAEVERVIVNIDRCKKTLQNLGYADFTFEDFFLVFIEQLENVLQGKETSISHDELLERSRDRYTSDYGVMFLRFVTAGEIRRRSDFFEPFIAGLTNSTVDKFIKSSVEPMNEESDHLHITALSDALGVAIRVMYLDRSSSSETSALTVNHHDFIPSDLSDNGASSSTDKVVDTNSAVSAKSGKSLQEPFVTLLYRPGHYDILYSK